MNNIRINKFTGLIADPNEEAILLLPSIHMGELHQEPTVMFLNYHDDDDESFVLVQNQDNYIYMASFLHEMQEKEKMPCVGELIYKGVVYYLYTPLVLSPAQAKCYLHEILYWVNYNVDSKESKFDVFDVKTEITYKDPFNAALRVFSYNDETYIVEVLDGKKYQATNRSQKTKIFWQGSPNPVE